MSQNIINTGQAANDGTGEPLRQAFTDINNNFSQIWSSGPVNSNVQITNNKIATLQTNQNLILAPNGIGAVQANTNIIPNTDHLRDLGSNTNRWDTMWGYNVNTQSLSVSGSATITGNLIVSGNIIEMGNIVTDTKTIQLSNTASNANSANGSGLTVGANDDIATLLYSSSSNTWTTNIGISTGNIIIQGDDIYDLVGPRISNGDLSHGATAGLDISTNGSNNATVLFNTYGNIQLQTSSTGANVYNYEFGANGNVSFPGNIGANGNIQGQYFLGNGRYLVGLPDGYNNQDAANFLANLGTNAVSTLGNVTAGYFFGNGSQLTGINKIINGTSNVDIPVANGNVTVTTNGTYTWKFEDTGTLVFPNATDSQIYGGLDNDFIITTANANAATYYFTFSQFGDLTVPINLNVSGNAYISDIVGPAAGNVAITANTQSWLFDDAGTITLPSEGQIRSVGNTGMRLSAGASDATGLLLNNTGDAELYSNSNVSVYTDAGNTGWTFDNTGNLTVPNIIQGSADSDYALKLGAFPEETAAGRWLQVRSGDVADHIHFDTSNNSAWNFYVGSDNQYVLIGNTGNISIGSYDSGNNATYGWTFDNTGNLTLPQAGVIYETPIPFGGLEGNTIALKPSGGTDADQQLLVYPTAGADFNHLHLTSGNLYNTELFLGDDNFHVKLANTGNVVINSNDGTGNTAQWNFDYTGNLTLPDNGAVTTSAGNITIKASGEISGGGTAGNSVVIQGGNTGTGDGGHIVLVSGRAPGAGGHAGNVNIIAANGAGIDGIVSVTTAGGTWTFDDTGTLTTPGNISTDWLNIGNIGNIVSLEAEVDLQIVANATSVNAPYWTFYRDGTMFVPGNISGDNSAPLIVEGSGSGEGYISLPSASFGGEQVAIVNKFGLGNGIRLETNGGNLFLENTGNLTVPGNIIMPPGTSLEGSGASPAPSISGFTSISAEVLSATGNVTGNYILGNVAFATGITATYGNADVATFLAAYGSNTVSTTGNVTTGNVLTSGLISATGNITGANILANSNLSVVGNIIANNFTGYGNIIFNQTLSTQGGSDMSLIPGTGLVRSYGNLRPYFTNTYDLGGSTTRWNNIYANVNNSITETVTGNITGGNVFTGGLISATGNVTGGNIRTTGLISATGSITTGGNVSAVDISLSGGAWATYTPSWQAFNIAPNIGNGTLTGRYKQLGKTVQVFISFTAGSTTTFGDGFWVFSLPVTARSTNNVILTGQFTDSGSYYEGVATNLAYPVNNAVSPYYNGAPVTSLAPTTWTSGAVLVFSGTYEAA